MALDLVLPFTGFGAIGDLLTTDVLLNCLVGRATLPATPAGKECRLFPCFLLRLDRSLGLLCDLLPTLGLEEASSTMSSRTALHDLLEENRIGFSSVLADLFCEELQPLE